MPIRHPQSPAPAEPSWLRQALLRAQRLILLATLASFPGAFAQDKAVATSPLFANAVEAALVRTFTELQAPSMRAAMSEIDSALARNPNFRLGHLIKGDLLMARSGQPGAFAERLAALQPAATVAMRQELRDEARARLDRYFDAPPAGTLPSSLLQLDARSGYVILVETDKHRLFVFANRNGRPERIADFYVTAGKNGNDKAREGDQKTPLGVYHVTSSVPRAKLPDFYGAGAFPINYPNDWDLLNRRNGSGIWLHGTPSDTYSRPPRASDGCVVLTNEDFAALSSFVNIGTTPVVITTRIEWLPGERWDAERASFQQALQEWRRDWESRDVERYLAHYSPNFRVDDKDFNDWAQRKRAVASRKQHVKVGIEVLSAYAFKGNNGSAPYLVVTYEQDYRSNNLNNRMKKRQYWSRENGTWKIVYENAA